MNELEEVEETNKKISKQQGLQSSNSVEQQAAELIGSMHLVKGHQLKRPAFSAIRELQEKRSQ